MSKEFEVPHDLAAFESKLRTASVSGSKINRDELLYEAGWAAASAQHAVGSPSIRNWAWPTATGVLATIAASLALLLFQQSVLNDQIDSAIAPALANVSAADILVEKTSEMAKPVQQINQTEKNRLNRSDGQLQAGQVKSERQPSRQQIGWQRGSRTPLASRLQLEAFDWRAPPRIDWVGPSPESSIKTNSEVTRELLREILPEHEIKTLAQPQLPIWEWFSQTWENVL